MKTLSNLTKNLVTNPQEFFDRLQNHAELYYHRNFARRPSYPKIVCADEAIEALSSHFSLDLKGFLCEKAFRETAAYLLQKADSAGGVQRGFDGHLDLASLSYAVARALKPDIVVETGVANGVTSTFILTALEQNGQGQLFSIDLQPLGVYQGEHEVGSYIPRHLRQRWNLSIGASKRVLPRLLRVISKVDMFLHDSLHSYHNVRRELRAITPLLSDRYAVLVDNIAGQTAFQEWVDQKRPKTSHIIKEGSSVFGLACDLGH